MNERSLVMAETDFDTARAVLGKQLRTALGRLDPKRLAESFDVPMGQAIEQAFRSAGADEGTVWWVRPDRKFLVPVFNNGPDSESIISAFAQPLSEGLISMVFVNGQSLLENHVAEREEQSKGLDEMLEQRTTSLIAVPLTAGGGNVGVISCVKLSSYSQDEAKAGFRPEDLEIVENLAVVLGELFEARVLKDLLDWGRE